MARRKVTFVYDPEKLGAVAGLEAVWRAWSNSDSLSVTVEDLPDPPIVEEFVVRITRPSSMEGLRSSRHQDIPDLAFWAWNQLVNALDPLCTVEVEVPDA